MEKTNRMIFAIALAATIAAAPTGASHGRYYGTPDLALTSQMLDAGGGPAKFSSHTLFLYLAGPKADDEAKSLVGRFGADNVTQFFATFDQFVKLAAVQVQEQHIDLPAPTKVSGQVLAQQLYQAGVMPDGRFDVGYMLEHLLSRPIHVTLMNEVNADPAFGPAKNASFHQLLTAAMQDLHAAYGG
jgi:hypothetical protein